MFRRFLIYGFLFACFSIALTAQTPSITLTVSPNPAPLGQPVNLTASIAASGTVSFYDGSMLLGTVPILQGKATLTTSLLPAGVRQLRALYFVQPDATAKDLFERLNRENHFRISAKRCCLRNFSAAKLCP